VFRQQRLKAASRAARAQVVATEFLEQLLAATDDPFAALDALLGREALAAFTHRLKSGPRTGYGAWHTS
jgi:hypothetical protein